MGLHTLREHRAIIDLRTLRIHFCGPGNAAVEETLPPGSQTVQCELSPSGHMVVSCGEFKAFDEAHDAGQSSTAPNLTLPVTTSAAAAAVDSDGYVHIGGHPGAEPSESWIPSDPWGNN